MRPIQVDANRTMGMASVRGIVAALCVDYHRGTDGSFATHADPDLRWGGWLHASGDAQIVSCPPLLSFVYAGRGHGLARLLSSPKRGHGYRVSLWSQRLWSLPIKGLARYYLRVSASSLDKAM